MASVATTGGTMATQQDENNQKSPEKKFFTPGSQKIQQFFWEKKKLSLGQAVANVKNIRNQKSSPKLKKVPETTINQDLKTPISEISNDSQRKAIEIIRRDKVKSYTAKNYYLDLNEQEDHSIESEFNSKT